MMSKVTLIENGMEKQKNDTIAMTRAHGCQIRRSSQTALDHEWTKVFPIKIIIKPVFRSGSNTQTIVAP